jgi:putative ABC transport system permease protein
MRDLARIELESLGSALPIALGATARKAPIVGTTVDYFDTRTLAPARGRMYATIGECVAGAAAARELALTEGSKLFTDPESLSNLAGVFPLELTIVGVLPPTNSPDDRAIFVDLRTMWSIRGLGHRHDEPAQSAAAGAVIGAKDGNTIAGEALPIERAAAAGVAPDFHFHGSPDDFPIDGALVYPADAKSQAILLGRFTGKDEELQLVRPDLFAERVLDRIFGVGRVLGAVAAGAAILVGLVAATTFALSIRLRAEELTLMRRLGASRSRIALFLAVEAALMLAGAALVAAAVAASAPLFAASVLRVAAGG